MKSSVTLSIADVRFCYGDACARAAIQGYHLGLLLCIPSTASLPLLAHYSMLVGMLLSVGGLVFPRSDVSHSPKFLSEACCARSFGDGGLAISLICAVNNGLQAVWRASEADLPVSGTGVVGCTGPCLAPLAVSATADQFLLLTDEVFQDLSRQRFLRNVLHHLVRAPESLPTAGAHPVVSGSSVWGAHGGDILVQLQCTLMMFEGYLASASGARRGRISAPGACYDYCSCS